MICLTALLPLVLLCMGLCMLYQAEQWHEAAQGLLVAVWGVGLAVWVISVVRGFGR